MPRKDKKTRLYEDVLAHLADLIEQGKLKPGDRLPPERVLAERLQVSRATLREALRIMQEQSLIVSRVGSGNYIAEGNVKSLIYSIKHLGMQDIFELRLLLDPPICALAAQRATLEDIARLEAILARQQKRVEQGLSGAKADADFHATLAQSTHNRALVRLGQALIDVTAPSRGARLQTSGRARASLTAHLHILEAIKAHSPEQAHRAMEDHIRAVDVTLFGLPEEYAINLPTFSSGNDRGSRKDLDLLAQDSSFSLPITESK